MVTVPAGDQTFINQAATGTGIPASVVGAQAQAESNFNSNAVSSTGAEGFWQFEPSTYNTVAAQAGVPQGTEFNTADETKAYIVYMNQLLAQEGGSVFKALEAYNAGPGNLSAGSAYASGILAAAGQSQALKANSPGTGIVTTGFNPNPLDLFGIPGSIENGISSGLGDIGNSFVNSIFSALGIPSLKDLLQRLGLILLGVVLVLVGISLLGKSAQTPINIVNETTSDESTGQTTKTRTVKTPVSKSTHTSLGVSDAIKSAAGA